MPNYKLSPVMQSAIGTGVNLFLQENLVKVYRSGTKGAYRQVTINGEEVRLVELGRHIFNWLDSRNHFEGMLNKPKTLPEKLKMALLNSVEVSPQLPPRTIAERVKILMAEVKQIEAKHELNSAKTNAP